MVKVAHLIEFLYLTTDFLFPHAAYYLLSISSMCIYSMFVKYAISSGHISESLAELHHSHGQPNSPMNLLWLLNMCITLQLILPALFGAVIEHATMGIPLGSTASAAGHIR